MASYLDTYYTRTLRTVEPRAALTGSLQADVCVVGAGMAGITTALELLRRGRSVILLEAQRVSWGASGRNGGVVSPGYSTSFERIAQRVGVEDAKSIYRMSIEGVDIVADNIRQVGIEEAHPVPGVLRVSRHENTVDMQAQQAWLANEFQYDVRFKTHEEIREWLVSDKYRHALYNERGFHFHPLNYARALVAEVERLGGQVFEDSEVLSLDCSSAVKRLKTSRGTVAARDVVFTCGGYTGNVVPQLARSYLPISTYMLVTEPAPDLIGTAIRTRASVGDSRRASDYYRLVDDGERILWGGMITTRKSEPDRLAELLRRRMVDTYPQLSALKVDLSWSGRMSYARHLMPLIGRLHTGVWYCMGFGGHGMNTTAVGGRLIAQGITNETDRYRLFAPFGLEWNGGPAGTAAVQLTYWYYQLMDFMRERAA
ncbi:oxidoreductase [Paraburkholderia monticola]|uniref:Oxidoreductase n=1 Tax=Paraburkholderia monticola TaxID=1399968 RepID=A0A149PJ73_9BURK|nr:FAD-binding oxidoreductase [Paraburkholderia monticola]KXU85062.1 oxidoreductase [Paraburkholderia monticola]